VLLNDLVPGDGLQRDLFFDGTDAMLAKNAKVILAMDLINRRYGRQTLKLGSEGFKAPWKMKQNLKSPGYTTDWAGLVKVR
jgi:DNA polymerase V